MLTFSRSSFSTLILLASACSDANAPTGALRLQGGLNVTTRAGTSLCSRPTWFAFKNDGGSWVRVVSENDGSVEFTAGPKVTIAFTTRFPAQGTEEYRELNVLYLARDEITDLQCGMVGFGPRFLTGSVSGLSTEPFELAAVGMGSGMSVTNTFYQLGGLPDGPLDLIASRLRPSTQAISRFVIRRGITLPSNSTVPVIDFATEGFDPIQNTVQIAPALQEEVSFYQSYRTDVTQAEFFSTGSSSTGSAISLSAWHVPGSQMQSGELHRAQVLQSGTVSLVGIAEYYGAPRDLSLTVAPEPPAPSFGVAGTTPHVRPSAEVQSQTSYGSAASVYFVYSTPPPTRGMRVLVSAEYLGATPATWELTVPDLSDAPGFPEAWGTDPQPGTLRTEQRLTVVGGRFGLVYPFSAKPTSGDIVRWGLRF